MPATVNITIKGDEELARDLRALRSDMKRIMRDESAAAAKRTVLPVAKMIAPSIARGPLMIKGTARGTFLTVSSRGMKRRIIGYINFGGTIKTPIVPKKAKALRLADGSFVARVSGPRSFRGLHFMEKSVDRSRSAYGRAVAKRLEGTIQQYINGRRHHRGTFA